MRRISLGGGFRYLMESVAVGDGAADRPNSLARYYAESGTPPGVFLGSGLADLNGGKGVEKGSRVTEEHLRNMLACVDPISGEPVGRMPNAGAKVPPVAGFDLTFSPPKSVSTAWALADEGTKAVIYDCHRRAVEYVLGYGERTMVHSRSGTNGIVQEDITGIVAVAFTHWDSRAGDPQLHDHVVVWNRAKSVLDGQWRTLDSRGLFKARSTLSAMYQGVLSDYLTEALGVGWEARSRRHSDQPRWEITGVPERLLREFSQRAGQIERSKDELIAEFVAAHRRQPTGVEIIRLRQQATIATRPDKVHRNLAEMTEDWRGRAAGCLGEDQLAWVTSLKDRNDLPLLRAGDLADDILADAAAAVVTAVGGRRATFSPSNLVDQAHRVLHGVRFAGPNERTAVAERIAELAAARSLKLTRPAVCHTPARYLRSDGSSRLHPKDHEIYTTPSLLDAEARLLDAGRRLGAPTVTVGTVAAVAMSPLPGRDYTLTVDQALAVEKIATSGRWLDVLIGPAGTGKSTTMAGVRVAWEAEHGAGSVIGLAPSAAAAEVLADELGIDTENTAKWLTEYRKQPERMAQRRRMAGRLATNRHLLSTWRLRAAVVALDEGIARWRLRQRQLVIVDEASLAGTFGVDELVSAAATAGAKVLLVGDWAQISAVEAGGAFGLVAFDRGDLAPELTDVCRFNADWEKAASIQLRLGQECAIDSYLTYGRVTAGSREELVDAIYTAWKVDTDGRRSSLMIAGDAATVAELNRRARADRVAAGAVVEDGLVVAGGQTAGVGDEVVTRQNNRLLAAGRRWVKNGDRWVVTTTNPDGSMAVRRAGGGGVVVLPADYVAEHVELAYATTAYRAQGRTVDTAHAMVSPTTSREVLYVAATRGRASNRIYVDTHYDPDPQTSHDGVVEPRTGREVLADVLTNEGGNVSAHEAIRRAQHEAESWTTLHAEYQTLAKIAQADRWDALLERSGLTTDQLEQVYTSEAYGPLLAAFRDAEARGLDIETAFPKLVRGRTLIGVEDVGSVLHGRVDNWVQAAGSRRRAADNLIAGLVPRAIGIADPDMARALHERDRALEQRARTLAEQAVVNGRVWAQKLGTPPPDPTVREQWLRAVSTVAAYRERWGVGADNHLLGPDSIVTTIEHVGHRKRAHAAVERALAISRQARQDPSPQVLVAALDAGLDRGRGVDV
jgi:conjugative relaxase-like TrwC/TraI family protein